MLLTLLRIVDGATAARRLAGAALGRAVIARPTVSRARRPINSQKVAQKARIIDQIDSHTWRFVDTTDRKLLSLLRDDGRMSVAAMAKALGVSRGTVQNRMARLEADGTVLGYTVRLKNSAEDRRVRALMTVAVEGNRTDEVLKTLRGDPAVCALHTTNGRWDIVAELRTDSLEAVDRVLGRIRQIDGISNTETSLLLSTHKY
jgi:DNA-binding Lrp family transcriptional regulator